MPSVTEGIYTAEWLISEANGGYSRENIVVVSGAGIIPSGRMMGRITASGKWDNYDDGLANGTEVCRGILLAGVDATSGDKSAVIVCRAAEVLDAMITAETGGHKAAGKTDLIGTTNIAGTPGSGLMIFR